MFCLATPLFRRGRKVSTNRQGPLTKCGLFRLSERRDADSHRTMRVATLTPLSPYSADHAKDLLLPLWDATVIFASRRYWTVTGIEREEIEGVEVSLRQTWALAEFPGEVLEEIESELRAGRPWTLPATMFGWTAVPPPPPEPADPRKAGAIAMMTGAR